MPSFRYPQFCALARAAEILCERWNLLIIRELVFGPQRFSDLRKGLGEVSPSVLTQRLSSLEAAGVIQKRALKPPAASVVYELAEAGADLMPAIRELGRWGARHLMPPESGEQASPPMVGFYLRLLACEDATPSLRLNIVCRESDDTSHCHVVGGKDGTSVIDGLRQADAELTGSAMDLLSVAGGHTDLARASKDRRVTIEGDRDAALRITELFRTYFPEPTQTGHSLPEQQD